MKRTAIVFILSSVLFFFGFSVLYAQDTLTGVALSVPISDGEAPTGSIVCSDKENYSLCVTEHDSAMYGVVDASPSAAIVTTQEGYQLVVTKGIVNVRVTAGNGEISVGDIITTSVTPGVGQKATRNGYVLGAALQEFKPGDPGTEGQINVSINIRPTNQVSTDSGSNLLEILRQGLTAPLLTPLATLRYQRRLDGFGRIYLKLCLLRKDRQVRS